MQYGPIKQSKDLKTGEVVRMLRGVVGPLYNEIVRVGKVPATGIPDDYRQGYDVMTVMHVADPDGTVQLEREMHRLERPYMQCRQLALYERFDLPVSSRILWEVLSS